MSSRVKKIALFSGAFLFLILLSNAPKLPSDKRNAAETGPVDLKLAQAIHLVEDGEDPMKGIMMLREILEEDSTNIEVHWHLGQFSIQSGQYDNAISRFEKVIEFDTENDFKEAWFWLGQIYTLQGENEKAISNYERYKEFEKDTVILGGVDRLIKSLEIN